MYRLPQTKMALGFQLDWSLDQMCLLTPLAPSHQVTQQSLAQLLLLVKWAKLGAVSKSLSKTMDKFGLVCPLLWSP
jgi:hypothetical protein